MVNARKIAFLAAGAIPGKLSEVLAKRQDILRSIASPGTQIDIFGIGKHPEKSIGAIESVYDAAMAMPLELECGLAAEKAGYQAVIISCGDDPGVVPLREILKIPVIPPTATAMHICSMLGNRFSLLTTGNFHTRRTELHERISSYDGLLKFVSVHPIGLSVLEVRAKPKEAYEAMVKEGKRAVEEYGADSLTFGCMSMAFLMVDDKLSKDIGIPVVNPVKTAVKMAELLIDLGLTHSKLAYPYPPSILKELAIK